MRVHNNYRTANLLVAVKLRASPRYAAVSAFKSAVRVVQPRQKNAHVSKIARVYPEMNYARVEKVTAAI